MRKFRQSNPSFSKAQIKMTFLEDYKEQVDAEAQMNIFEDVFDDEEAQTENASDNFEDNSSDESEE